MLSLWLIFLELNSSLSILSVFCSKPSFRNAKIIIAEIPFFYVQSIIGQNTACSFSWPSVGAAELTGP